MDLERSLAGCRIRIDLVRIQHFLIAEPDPDTAPDPGFDDKKLKKITAEKNLCFLKKKNCNLLIHMPP
jgi:hypothetical protein